MNRGVPDGLNARGRFRRVGALPIALVAAFLFLMWSMTSSLTESLVPSSGLVLPPSIRIEGTMRLNAGDLRTSQNEVTTVPSSPSLSSPPRYDGQILLTSSAPSPSWNVEYLPAILNTMVTFYKSNLLPSSLSMMLPPVLYSEQNCPVLLQRHLTEYRDVISKIDFTRPPKYKMPWYYHDPYALCGRYQLTHLLGGQPAFVHRATIRSDARHGETSDGQMHVARIFAGEESVGAIMVEHCGRCSVDDERYQHSCSEDVLLQARLIGDHSVVHVDVLPVELDPHDHVYRSPVRLLAREPGEYILEIKVVHVNGSSSNASFPKSLGVIGIRASDHNRKSFKYNIACDLQRHIYGSPIKVVATVRPGAPLPLDAAVVARTKPVCNISTYVQGIGTGHWARVPLGSQCEQHLSGSLCVGDPTWMTDACGFNTELVWVPDSCRMRVYTPPKGPEKSCLHRGRSGFLLFVGDSVTREYVQNCRLLDLRNAKLHCLFANIALEGQHYSLDYAKAVVQAMIDSLKQNKPGVFASNLGIHHMIGKSSTEQWVEFIDLFVAAWKKEAIAILPTGTDAWLLEKAVWLGPPTIHYARHGMGFQRAALWDEIAWNKLKPLGFIRLYGIPPTLGRTEATWDGLHYAAYKGKVQSPWRNRNAAVLLWNGGVANMMFNILLNLICDE